MTKPAVTVEDPVLAHVVHKSMALDQAGRGRVVKMMLNLAPQGRKFEAGGDIAFLKPGGDGTGGLRRFTVESVGEVPFEDSVDLTIYLLEYERGHQDGIVHYLLNLEQGDPVDVYGPLSYPFYPPSGSRSNVILIGAGCGMVPFRWLARRVQERKLDWMGKVLMLEGPKTGLEHRYLNLHGSDQDQYFDNATYRAFEALKTRYSATARDREESLESNMDALWRLMGQGSVYVYRAGYRPIAEAMDHSMSNYLRLAGRWEEAKAALRSAGHWQEYLYD